MLGVGGYAPSMSSLSGKSDWQGGQYVHDVANDPFAPDYLKAGYQNANQVLEALKNGEIDPYTAQYYISQLGGYYGFKMTPDQEKYLNNMLAQYQSKNALLWQAEQLQSLGLSNAGVLQTGAAHTASDMSNQASARADRMKSIANSLIGMTSRAIGAGIHGAALQGLKDTAGSAIDGVVKTTRSQLQHYDRTGRALGSTVRFDTVSQKFNHRI